MESYFDTQAWSDWFDEYSKNIDTKWSTLLTVGEQKLDLTSGINWLTNKLNEASGQPTKSASKKKKKPNTANTGNGNTGNQNAGNTGNGNNQNGGNQNTGQ